MVQEVAGAAPVFHPHKTFMTAWIFDVDGVITNLTAEKILLQQIPMIISDKLKKGEPVAFMTGRSLKWLEETTLSIMQFSENEAKNLFIAAEFGGIIATYTNGQLLPKVNSSYVVPQFLRQKAEGIVNKYSGTIELEDKQTLFSSKIKKGESIERFGDVQQKAMIELKQLLEELRLSDFKVHGDSIGLNIRYKLANKKECINKLLAWLYEKKITVDKFTVFGDSASDLEMGEGLGLDGLNFEFVFVGKKLEKTPSFTLFQTDKKHDEGTLEYLKTH